MADYNGMKVPELKKLLQERGLTQTGNKADLIARLVENDKATAKNDEPEAGEYIFCLCLAFNTSRSSTTTSSQCPIQLYSHPS